MRPLLISALLFFFIGSACKKGPQDPELSLRTRTARLSGHWLLEKGTTSFTKGGLNISLIFDGSEVRQYFSNSPVIIVGKSSLSLDFDKKGNFSIDETVSGTRSMLSGNWSFNAKSKNYKSKELLSLQANQIDIGSTYNCYLTQFATTCTYEIERLSNNELSLLGAGSYVDGTDQLIKYTSEFHLVKKK